MGNTRYDALEGVRVIMCLWVLMLHMTAHLTALIPDTDTTLQFHTLPWNSAARLRGCQVDVFFAITGFLITSTVLRKTHEEERPLRSVFQWIAKRAIRMWPGMFVALFMAWAIGDYNVDIPQLLWKIVTFTTNSDTGNLPLSMTPTWSNSVDVRAGATMLGVLLLSKRYGMLSPIVPLTMLLMATAILMILFFQDPDNTGMLAVTQRNVYRVGWTTGLQAWVNTTFDTGVPIKAFYTAVGGRMLYLATWTRWGPMFLGGLLAFRVRDSQTNAQPRPWWRVILAVLLALFIVAPPKRILTTPTEFPTPPLIANLFVTVGMRLAMAFLWCEILYAALVPESHPAHNTYINRFLSARPLAWYAQLTYPIYLLHYRLGISVVMAILHPARKAIWAPILGAEFGFLHVFVCWVLTVLVTTPVAYVVHRYVEQPIFKHRDKILSIFGLEDAKSA